MKIALPASSFLPAIGGAEIGLHNICLNLIKKGHSPFIITCFNHIKLLKKISLKTPYQVISLPPKILYILEKNFYLGCFIINFYLKFLQNKYKFDFWHATFGYPLGLAVIKFCKKNSLPHLMRCVGEDIQIDESIAYGYRIDKKKDFLIQKYYKESDCMIAVTNSIKNEYLKIGIDKKKIKVIPNGVDTKRIKNIQLKKKNKKKRNNLIFLALGRYHIKKNFEILLTVTDQLIQDGYKFNLVIVGHNMQILKSKVNKLRLGNIIKIYEPKNINFNINEIPSDEVLSFYNESDCFLMPSKVESFGIVTIEAMTFGLPVIAASSPGNIDILDNGKFGIIYDGTKADLIKKMKSVIDEKKKLSSYSLKSKIRSKQFDWSYIVDKYLELYSSLIKKKN